MICNIADGTWTLESKDIDNLNLIVAKIVTERANDDKIKTFNTERFIKYIHDLIEKKTGDKQQAITFARQVPSALQMTMMSFPDVKDALKGKGYDVATVDDIESRFRNSLQDVANFIAEQSATKGAKNLAGQINSITEAERMQPTPAPSPAPQVTINKGNDFDLPYNPLSTTGNELIPGREWYYGFIKKLGNLIIAANGTTTEGTVRMPGVDGGVRLSLVKGGIPLNQLYPDEQNIEGIENITANQYYAVVTNAQGEYVYFNDGYEPTTEDKGKLVYFPIRTVPSFTVNENNIREYRLEEQMGKSIQTIEDRVKKNKNLTKEDVITEYSFAYDLITDMKNYLDSNPGERLPLNITGYDEGTINYDPDTSVALSALKTNYTLDVTNTGSRGYKYIILPDGSHVKVAMATYSSEMANNVANLLTGDVTGADGKVLSANQKYLIIRDFTALAKDGISINASTGEIYLKGETLDPKAPGTKEKIIDFLTRVETIKDENGKEKQFKNQFSFDKQLYNKPTSVVDMFSLTPLGNDKFTYVSNLIPYKEWVSNNAYIKARLDENGNVRMLNGYIKYDASPTALETLYPKEEDTAAPKEVTDQIKPGLAGLSTPTVTNTKEISEADKAKIAGIKLYSMRHASNSATAKQIADGKKWYDTLEITFKDETGKTVTKKITDVIPYEVLFTYANSNKDIRAQFTKNGITLFKGSDSTALYHEAWHGFTQLFMTKDERQKLYNEVKKLAKTITYYNHNTTKWETMNSKDLDFSNRQHILYAEEYLADEFREYAKTRKTESSKLKSFFKYIWNVLKALFGRSGNSALAEHTTESEILNSAFNELYTGNFIERTYNQENTEFDVLYSGITLNTEENGVKQHLDLDASLAIAEALGSYISEYIDALPAATGQKKAVFSLNMLYNSELKKLALTDAYNSFIKEKTKLISELDSVDTYVEQQIIEKRLAYIQTAIDNFGDLENLDNNKDAGVIAYYNKRTGFLDMTDATLTEDGADDTFLEEDDAEEKVEGAATTQLSSTDGTEKSDFQRIDPVLKFVMSSIHNRVPVTEQTPDGYKYNSIGVKELADPRVIYNLVSSNVEGLNDREAMYKKLKEVSGRMTNGVLDPQSLMVKQFLDKVGEPTTTSLGAQALWAAIYHSVRYDRIPSMKMLVEKSSSGIDITVGVTDSSFKAVEKLFKNNFQLNNPSKSKFFDADGNVNISVASLKKKYQGKNANDVDPVKFLADLGIAITPNLITLKKIKDAGIIEDILTWRLNRDLFSKENKVTELKSLMDVIGTQNTVFNKLFAIEALSNPTVSNYMSKTAEDKSKSERSNPSAAGNIVLDLNAADHYKNVINQPHLAHFNSTVNPFVRTSLIFQRMFGEELTNRKNYKGTITNIDIMDLSGSQLVNVIDADVKSLVKGVKSAESDKQTAWLRDFFFVNLYGATEAYRHADKSSAYIAKLVGGDATTRFYIRPELFVQGRSEGNNSQGRIAANAIITDYIGAELERVKKVRASKNNVAGEKASDIILYGKPGNYTTYEKTGSDFTVFDGILSDKVKNYLLDSNINTVDDFRKAIKSNDTLKFDIENDLNAYFSNEIAKDTAALNYYGLNSRSGELKNIIRSFKYTVKELVNGKEVSVKKTPSIDELFPSAVENFVYTSFIHRMEMNTLIYGDPALYNHNKDEHMKRVPAFFATGKIPVADNTMDKALADNAGSYAESGWFKTTGLSAPQKGALEGRILSTAVLEDAIEDSAYFDTMVKYAARLAVNKGQFADEESAIKFYSEKYEGYKNMKSADAEAWISFDAYRALEIRLNNWGPRKEQLYKDILAGVEINPDEVAVFFPVKKLQYAGPISTKNFAVNAFHKYSVMPLIPTVIKGTKLEKLHNKMVSQGIAYSVMHSGSKLASLGNQAKLDLFYNKPKGDGTTAFTDPGYVFTKNDIFLQYLKEQLATHDTWHDSIKFPTQARKLITSGVLEQGFPVDFETRKSDSKRKELWDALTTKEAKENASPAYALEQRYQRAINNMVDVSKELLKQELGYSNGKINQQKLIKFIKDNLSKRDVSLYDTEYLKVNSEGNIALSADLSNDPAKIEKLITSLVNKRIVDQLTYGEAYIQGSGIGYEKYTKPTKADLESYGTNGLVFYRPVDENGVIVDDPKKAVAIRPMQVKVALQGDFLNLLELAGPDGEKIGTIDRLNQAIKNEKWLSTGDNRKMITMGATRIPTASINYIDAMEIAEFLPAEAGNVMILPSEVVAKSGSDFDIDKMIVIKPVISINKQGEVEYTRATAKSKSPRDFQNEILDTWTELILRPANYTSLTLPNSTDIFEGEGKIVEQFSPINRPESYINSPTKIMQNTYNINRAVAMSVGKAGIGMLATGATFFNLYKTIGLTMNPESLVYNTKRTKSWDVKNILRVQHNQVKDNSGENVISLSHTLDADGKNDIADVITQLMNGYLDVAKNDWVFDINATKEFEPELEFMIMAGVPVETAVALLSQPMVRQYLEKVQRYSGILPLAKGEISNVNFAKYQAVVDTLAQNFDNLAEDREDQVYLSNAIEYVYKTNGKTRPTGEILSLAQGTLNTLDINFELDELKKRAKKGEVNDDYDLATFLHFLEIQNMAKGNVELKKNLNFDTSKQQSLFEANQKKKNLLTLSDKFSKQSINKLLNETILHNFISSDIMNDAISSILPLRGLDSVNYFLAEKTKGMSLDPDAMKKYQSDFVNNLSSFMFYNYFSAFDPAATTYRSEDLTEASIEKQPLLRFGAFYDKKAGKLFVDNYAIDEDYKTKAFSKAGYGLGLTANLPIDIFAGYTEIKARTMYRHFVYEREMLRESIPYKTIESNGEYELFKYARMRDLNSLKRPDEKEVDYDLPKLYEEFIRNKALDNILNVNALLKTDKQLGIYSMADRYRSIITDNPQLLTMFPVLNTFRTERTGGYSFIKQAVKIKDQDILTSYTSQMMRLMDPTEVIAEREYQKQAIAAFFSKLPLVSFMQSGNDPNSRISMGSIFDQTKTGLPEMLTSALANFVSDLESERAEAILDTYALLFDRKQAGEDEETGKYIPGALYVNYSADLPKGTKATQITSNLSIVTSEIKKDPHWKKDEAMANASTKAIAKATTPKTSTYKSSTKAYLAAIGGASTQFTNSDSVWVFGAGGWSATAENIKEDFENYYKPTIDKAIASGVTTFNVGKASGIDTLATDYLKGKGFNIESKGEWNQLTSTQTTVKPTIDLNREWRGDLESRPVYTAEGINTMRTTSAKADEHFGNPFSEAGYGNTIKVSSIGAAVRMYKDWLLNNAVTESEIVSGSIKDLDKFDKQRTWILDQINQGKLDNATLLYAGKSAARGQGMHPTALAEAVEILRSGQTSMQVSTARTIDIEAILSKYSNERPSENWASPRESAEIFVPLYEKLNRGEKLTADDFPPSVRDFEEFVNSLDLGVDTKLLTDGKPTILYHGSPSKFGIFKEEFLGTYTNAPSAKQAFFAALDPDTAIEYGERDEDAWNTLGQLEGDNPEPDWESERISELLSLPEDDPKRIQYEAEREQIRKSAEEAEGKYFTVDYDDDTIDERVTFRKRTNLYPLFFISKNPLIVDVKNNRKNIGSINETLIKAKADGYDAVVFKNIIDGGNKATDVYTVFSSSQIKNIIDVMNDRFAGNQALGNRKTYSGKVTSLQPNQIFVFGSNEGSSKGGKPTHGAGSAKIARDEFGAIQGQSRGLQGQSYAIVTKKFYDVEKSSTPREIIAEIKGLYEYAKQNSDKEFLVSDYSEGNLNGYTGQEMADMFNAAGSIPSNIVFNQNFDKLVVTTQTPLVREVSDQSGKKFPGLLKDQRGVIQVLDFETNKPMLAPQVYDESKFVSGNTYSLTAETVKEIAQENPSKLFVFDDYFPTTTGATKTTGSDYSRQAWIPAKAMGIAFGVPTLSLGVSTSLPVTDQNYDQLKAQIDKGLDELLEKKRQGAEIVFPSRGLGQSLIGFETQPTQNVYVGNAPAPSLFVYLSKRLLQDFGYNNPLLNNLTTKTAGVTEMLGKETGIAFVQDYYKTVKAQSVTDTDIKEFIKKCKGLS